MLETIEYGSPVTTPSRDLFGILGEMVALVGSINLLVTLGSPLANVRRIVEFLILDTQYNL